MDSISDAVGVDGSKFAGRLGRATWFFESWGYLIASYVLFGFLYFVWKAESQFSAFRLLLGIPLAVVAAPFLAVVGLVLSFPTLVVAPFYLAVLRRIPRRWGPRVFRLAAIVLAPPALGSLTFAWWISTGGLDWFLARCLLAVLLIYGLIVPSPFQNSVARSRWRRLLTSIRHRPKQATHRFG